MPFSFEINTHTLPALIVGGFLMLVAITMSLRQWWSHRELQRRVKVDEYDYSHLERQIQRRLVMSGLFFLVGFLISIGNRLDGFIQQTPNSYFTYSFTFLGGVLLFVAASPVFAPAAPATATAPAKPTSGLGLGLATAAVTVAKPATSSKRPAKRATGRCGPSS